MKHEKLLVRPGHPVRLADLDPGETLDYKDKDDAAKMLASDIDELARLQELLAASATRAILIVLQGMDTSGKDGAIKHVMTGVNPQGVDVHSFKQPSDEELRHDFLWRAQIALPERGRIGIFNRSYYEEVLVVRVHRDLLDRELPASSHESHLWSDRFEDINAFERHLQRNGTEVIKFFLHISKEEQRKRLLKRLDDPSKLWKFSVGDVREREYWDDYQRAYEQMLNATSTAWAPWHVIPCDHKWFMRAAIADIVVRRLRALDLHYPVVDAQQTEVLRHVRDRLEETS